MIPGKHYGPHDLLAVARRRKWLILIPAVTIMTAVSIGIYTLPDQFRSDTLILVVPQRVPESYVKATVTSTIEDRLQSIQQQILSRTRLERIIQDFNLYAKERKTGIMEDIVENMRKDIVVQTVRGDAFRVSFLADDARVSMKVTERLASLFIEENLRDREVLAESTNQFLEAQLEDARRRLADTEKKLEDYRKAHAGEMPKDQDANMQGQHNTEMQLQAYVESLNRDRDQRLNIDRMLADLSTPDPTAPAAPVTPPPVPTEVQVPTGGTIADQLVQARAMLAQQQMAKAAGHPDVKRMQRIVADLEQKLAAEQLARPLPGGPSAPKQASPAEIARQAKIKDLTTQRDQLDRQIATKVDEEKRLREIIRAYQARLEMGPTREAELTELTRDYETLQTVYKDLLSKREDSKVAANLERRQIGEQFKILDPARLPEKPSSPDRVRDNLLGAILALGLAFAITAVVEYEDETLRNEEDVRQALNLLVLATVPSVVPKRALLAWRRRVMALSAAAAVLLVGVGGFVAWRFFLR